MFRLQDNVPQIYVEESRDFQLFCRLYDCINNGVMFDISTISYILDPMRCNDRVLELLSTKVGFFPKTNIESNILRYIISAFPYIIKYKGSKKGIKEAVCTILRAEGKFEIPKIEIMPGEYEIKIELSNATIKNKKALDEVLRYILPIGYTYSLGSYSTKSATDEFNIYDMESQLMVNPASSTSQIRGSSRIKSTNNFDFKSDIEDKNIGYISNLQIIGSQTQNRETKIYSEDRLKVNRDGIDLSSKATIYNRPNGDSNDG